LNPLSPAFSYPPVILGGRVLSHPKIHNLYLDSDWDAHNPDAPSRAQINALMQELVNSGYFNDAGQYGIGQCILDNTAPVITIVQPTATEYTHSAVLTLDYAATDGAGSGVASLTALLDGSSTLAGHGLGDGQAIKLLFELALGDHT